MPRHILLCLLLRSFLSFPARPKALPLTALKSPPLFEGRFVPRLCLFAFPPTASTVQRLFSIPESFGKLLAGFQLVIQFPQISLLPLPTFSRREPFAPTPAALLLAGNFLLNAPFPPLSFFSFGQSFHLLLVLRGQLEASRLLLLQPGSPAAALTASCRFCSKAPFSPLPLAQAAFEVFGKQFPFPF